MAYSLIISYNPNTEKYSYTIDINSPYDGCIICPCSITDKHIFKSMTSFKFHIQTQIHKRWIKNITIKNVTYKK